MRTILLASLIFIWSILSFIGISVASEDCVMLLQDGVRSSFYEKYDSSFLDQFHSALCSESNERIEKIKKTGINLGYKDFIFDFAGSSRKIMNYQDAMCSTTAKISSNQAFNETVRNHIDYELVNGFNECIKITQGGMKYRVIEGTEGDSITIEVYYDRSVAPHAQLDVTHITIVPDELKDKIVCQGPLSSILDGEPIHLNQTIGWQTITCMPKANYPRKGDNDFSVRLHTNLGTIEGHVKPFFIGKSDRLAVLNTKLEKKSEDLQNRISKVESDAYNNLNSRFSNIAFSDPIDINRVRKSGLEQKDLGSIENRSCFLTRVRMEETDTHAEWAECRVIVRDGRWKLQIGLGSGGGPDTNAHCEARCITW